MRKGLLFLALLGLSFMIMSNSGCDAPNNTSALDEQAKTERNQRGLNNTQPAPSISWSLERDNLIKRTKLQNDRAVMFFMYVFVEGVAQPVGYYQVTKVSSVNSQLTNPAQLVYQYTNSHYSEGVLPSPAEDGSYGENGSGVFGFTPEDVYIETNMHYISSTIPLHFAQPVNLLAVVNTDEIKNILSATKKAMK